MYTLKQSGLLVGHLCLVEYLLEIEVNTSYLRNNPKNYVKDLEKVNL